jgi:hypothetical protein
MGDALERLRKRLRSFGALLANLLKSLVDVSVGFDLAGSPVEFLDGPTLANALELLLCRSGVELTYRDAFFFGDGFDLFANLLINGNAVAHDWFVLYDRKDCGAS